MLTNEEEKFLSDWQQNRTKQTSIAKRLSVGLPLGLLIGAGIILNYISGWYTRATMVANGQSTPLVLVIAVVIIVLFSSYFYRQHKWEMNEQRYQELLIKKQRDNSAGNMQQDVAESSQSKQ